ncbi:MAG: aminodeoxychorismate synthase component I [Planctomycetaceae bacterium]
MLADLPDLGRLRAERVPLPPPGDSLFRRLSGLQHLAILDSSLGGRYTLIASSPLARLTWTPQRGAISLPGGGMGEESDPAVLLREAIQATALHAPGPLPFGPGWIGVLGYGLRTAFEEVPERHPDDTGLPDIDLSYYPAVAVHDAEEQAWWLVWREEAGDGARKLHARLMHAGSPLRGGVKGSFAPRIRKEAYLAAVRRAIEYIRAGDLFQVNLSHEFRAPFLGDPLALYLNLRQRNPSAYAAFLDLGGGQALLSTSPELFLRLKGHEVTTRPIKGTRPRGATPAQDEALREELAQSEKDGAELAMIVDLERNDLGRVCEPGSIEVVEERAIESYATVHHLAAEVRGVLEAGRDRIDLLAAAFPGGSITGAPKIRAMEIIDELEAGRRGPYTGSVGIFGDDGSLDLNIAIRTLLLARGEARLHVGGGIVADSDPEAEYRETLAKGEAIFRTLAP